MKKQTWLALKQFMKPVIMHVVAGFCVDLLLRDEGYGIVIIFRFLSPIIII